MLLRTWLAGWHRATRFCLGGAGESRSRLGRSAYRSEFQSAVECLEQRLVLSTIELSHLGSQGVRYIGAAAGDNASQVSNAGDVNGDGFDDFVVGATGAAGANDTVFGTGQTYIIFGSPTSPNDIDFADAGAADVTIFGADNGDFIGFIVSEAGDVNGDGFGDIVISSSGKGPDNSRLFTGECYIVFGGASLPATIDLADPDAAVTTIYGRNGGKWALAEGAGDFNGDGFDDVVIGSPYTRGQNQEIRVGQSYIVYGKASLPATLDLEDLGSAGMTINGGAEGDQVGYYVSEAGDINGDGMGDVLIQSRAPDFDGEFNDYYMQNYLVFGRRSPAAINLANLGGGGVKFAPFEGGKHTGSWISGAGDVNGDGRDDLLISDLQDSGTEQTQPEKTYLVYGRTDMATVMDLTQLGGGGVTFIGGVLDRAGARISDAGDVNSDGFADILIAAWAAHGKGGTPEYAGQAYVVFGGPTLPATMHLANLGANGITIFGDGGDERFGISVSAAGDFNGDNADDFLIGCFGPDESIGRVGSGRVYLIYGTNGPVLDADGPPPVFTKSDSPAAVLEDVGVNQTTLFAGGTLTLTVNAPGSKKKPADSYQFPSTSNLGSSAGPQFANGRITLQIQLNQSATGNTIQAFLRGIRFSTKGKGLKVATRTIEITFTPATGAPITIERTINIRRK